MYTLTQAPNQDESMRSLSGIILKNNLKNKDCNLSPELKQYIKEQCMHFLGDSSNLVRATIGILITALVGKYRLSDWPQLPEFLLQSLGSNIEPQIEGALGAFHKILEDTTEMFEPGCMGPVFNSIMAKCVDLMQHTNPRIRSLSLQCINTTLITRMDALENVMNDFLRILYGLAYDEDPEVKKNMVRTLVMLVEMSPEYLEPNIDPIIEFMLTRTQDDSMPVALEACEFWLSMTDVSTCQERLRPYLPRLVPVLLKCMKYTEADIVALHGEDEAGDATVPDKDEDMRPRFAKSSKLHSHMHVNEDGKMSGGNKNYHHGAGDNVEMDDDDDFEDDFDDDDFGEWSLRKCSAAALDMLASVYRGNVLQVLLPHLKAILEDNERHWIEKESAILALGAVAEGCMSGMDEHLPQLVPFLLTCLSDKKPLVRSITCWTLSRYTAWISMPPANEQFFPAVLEGILKLLLDNNKKVQEAACSAFAGLEEDCGQMVIPFLPVITFIFEKAFSLYQNKNLLILYDAIGTLAESAGEAINQPQYVGKIMPGLLTKWDSISNEDRCLFPLLECLTSLAMALKVGFKPFAEPIFKRCLVLIDMTLRQELAAANMPDHYDLPDRDIMIVSLDMISGMAEGMGSDIGPLVQESSLINLLVQCMTDKYAEVRQSAFALLGDITKASFQHIEKNAGGLMKIAAENLNPEAVSVCNNATWAIGEMTVRMRKEEIQKYLNAIVPQLVECIRSNLAQRTLLENTAITLGRLGLMCPDEMAPFVKSFVKPWCQYLRNVRDNSEKLSAFMGMCAMIFRNPDGVREDFVFFCDAVASWVDPGQELATQFAQILQAFKKELSAEEWTHITNILHPMSLERLRVYGV